MRRTCAVILTSVAVAAVPAAATAAAAKHDKTYGTAKTACHALPKDKLASALGLPATATPAQIATAYAKREKTKAKQKSARAGCLAGLQSRSS